MQKLVLAGHDLLCKNYQRALGIAVWQRLDDLLRLICVCLCKLTRAGDTA